MTKRIGESGSFEAGRCHGVFALVSAAFLLLGCGVKRCPEGSHARYDQCVRLVDDHGSDGAVLPDAGVESGVDGSNGGCPAARLWRDGRCVLKRIYVDALDGDDAYEGTLQNPLKTLEKALSSAVDGQIVSFAAREYPVASGDELTPLVIPDGVTLRTLPDSDSLARFVADGTRSLVFAGRATLESLDVSGFRSVLATVGEQQLKGVILRDVVGSVSVLGQARMLCEQCSLGDVDALGHLQRTAPLVVVADSATLTVTGGAAVARSDVPCDRAIGELIRVTGTANLTLDNFIVVDGEGVSVLHVETQGSVKLVSSELYAPCPGTRTLEWRQAAAESTTATLHIDDSLVEGSVALKGNMQSVRVRASTLKAPFVIESATSGTYDLGLPAGTNVGDVGWNFFAHLAVSGSGVVVSASGNKWQASLQGADENGLYTRGETRRVDAGQSITGENFSLTGDGGSVELQF